METEGEAAIVTPTPTNQDEIYAADEPAGATSRPIQQQPSSSPISDQELMEVHFIHGRTYFTRAPGARHPFDASPPRRIPPRSSSLRTASAAVHHPYRRPHPS